MRNDRPLTAWEAVMILFPPETEAEDYDEASFRSGADVCELLVAHFGFDGEDFERLLGERADPERMNRWLHEEPGGDAAWVFQDRRDIEEAAADGCTICRQVAAEQGWKVED